MTKTAWFDVDKTGLAKLMAGRPKSFVLYELLQNAWDQNVTGVVVTLKEVPGKAQVEVSVEDDDPDGFADLRDAYTLFAESKKKVDATKRGRFNLGEKLVLALAIEATIITTKGGVRFDAQGRHTLRSFRASGSIFTATIPMTRDESNEVIRAAFKVLPPVPTTLNGQNLPTRVPVVEFETTLPTLIADRDGVLCKSLRKTTVRVFNPDKGPAMLYEMGIPVVESGDKFDIDVAQKIPLTLDRDNVTPGFLRGVRVAVLNHTYGWLEQEDMAQTWVREAVADKRVDDAAVRQVIKKRFGEDAVSYDPSDLEANKRSVAAGRPIVHGPSLSAEEWANVRRAEAILPAGKVTPSPKPFSPDGSPLLITPESEWTAGMWRVRDFALDVAAELLDHSIFVQFTHDKDWPFNATYGKKSRELTLNTAALGKAFFSRGISNEVIDLVIHEFGHEYEGDHLSEAYYDALTSLGARMTRLALTKPEIFE